MHACNSKPHDARAVYGPRPAPPPCTPPPPPPQNVLHLVPKAPRKPYTDFLENWNKVCVCGPVGVCVCVRVPGVLTYLGGAPGEGCRQGRCCPPHPHPPHMTLTAWHCRHPLAHGPGCVVGSSGPAVQRPHGAGWAG